MESTKELTRLLGLSSKESKVLEAVKDGFNTPLVISSKTKVSRPAIYEALNRFKKRGLVKTNIKNGKKYWSLVPVRSIEASLFDAKKFLLDVSDGVEEIRGVDDATVIVHRGAEALHRVVQSISSDYKDKRIYMIQGDKVSPGWTRVFGLERINKFNRSLKKNQLISEMVVNPGLFERQIEEHGEKWAIDFEGRTAMTHYMDGEGFEHAGQIWIIKNSMYLMAIEEEVIIEVRNSDIQELVLSMFRFIQDHSRKIDVNALLRELINIENT